jgi:hypothetical protein
MLVPLIYSFTQYCTVATSNIVLLLCLNFLHVSLYLAHMYLSTALRSNNKQSGIVVCSNDTSVANDVSTILNRAQEMYTAGAYR